MDDNRGCRVGLEAKGSRNLGVLNQLVSHVDVRADGFGKIKRKKSFYCLRCAYTAQRQKYRR